MRRVAVAVAVLALGALAPAAQAASQSAARKAAERVLLAGADIVNPQPHGFGRAAQRRGFRRVVAIHRMKRALPARAVIGQGVQRKKNRKAGRRTFLFWGDYAPGAGFVHPSRLALVDARTGKVYRVQDISFWPEVNRKRVFTKGRGRFTRPRRPAPRAAVVPGFANDCVVTIGDRTDPYFLKGIAAINRMAQRHGMPVSAARRVRDLGPAIDGLAKRNPPCKDVMIYIGGHGWAPQNSTVKLTNGSPVAMSDKARVTIKAPGGGGQPPIEENVDLDDIKKLVHDRPNLTFKLAVESCFSGRWTVIMAEPNVRITVTSSLGSEVTFLAVTHAQKGMQVNGQLQFDESASVGTPDAADDPPPFTKGLTEAVDNWASDPANQNKELGAALSYSGTHHDGDRARALGWQHGRTDDRTSTRPPGPGSGGPTPFTLTVNGSYRHIGPGSSETCWGIQTNPPRPNTVVTITVHGPNNYSQSRTDSTNSSGFVRLRTPISVTGDYTADVNATADDGERASGSGSVTVTAADGTCPPP
jgi:hypothetical protein